MSTTKEKEFRDGNEPLVNSIIVLEDPNTMKCFKLSSSSSSSSSSSLPSPSRFYNNKTIFALVAFIVVLSCYLISSKMLEKHINDYTKQRYWYLFNKGPCSKDKKLLEDMAHLAVDASSALESLGSNPVACYGTLLGVLRRGGVLPWDNNVDLCLVNPISKDVDTIRQTFSQFNIYIEPYDTWMGHYRFDRNNIEGFITVFSECSILDSLRFRGPHTADIESEPSQEKTGSFLTDGGFKENSNLCPDGRLPYITQFVQGHTKPIPAQLLSPPFPTMSFGARHRNTSIAIPAGDVEIVKYWYPSSWWLSVKPRGCQ